MANPRPTTAYPGSTPDPVMDGPEDVEVSLPDAPAPGTDEVGSAAVPVAVTYPDWRREELARKYDDNEHEERYERGFYHPFG